VASHIDKVVFYSIVKRCISRQVMQTSKRRVRRLKISSRNEATLASDLHALQDALNTASFPGVQPNGLLLVRKLDLGLIRPHSSKYELSRSIDNRIQSLCIHSVCVDEEDAPAHDVVWFSDPAHAVFRLVELVADHQQVNAWYWTVLFPEYSPEMSLQDVLILVSRGFIDKDSRPWVIASVIQQLYIQGHIQQLLTSIKPSLAQALLLDCGIHPGEYSPMNIPNSSSCSTHLNVSESWQELIGLSISIWGREDARTLWMAVSALVIKNPAIVKAGQLLIRDVTAVLDQMHLKTIMGQDAIPSNKSDQHAGLASTSTGRETTGTGEKHAPANSSQPGSSVHGLEGMQSNVVSMHKTDPHLQHRANPDKPVEHGLRREIPTERDTPSKNSFKQRHPPIPRINGASDFVQQYLHTGLSFNRQSGFVFLISLLERLCIDDCLSLNPELALINLPARLVRSVAKRMNIDSLHPLLRALPEQVSADQEKITGFVSPSPWISLTSLSTEHRAILYRFNIRGAPGRCCITDHSQKLVLYIGDGRSSALPEWIRQCLILDRPGLHDYPRLNDIENTIQLLISRYLFRYAGIGLRSLINRSGKIACSRTHLDVIFDFEQLDIRIRKAGLDINPGWVSWLGRVIEFHYESGGRDHA
jgi:hypothetical protein